MTDVFRQTAAGFELERQLLERHDSLFASLAAPVSDIPPVIANQTDLQIANQNFDSTTVKPGTRHGILKVWIHRLLSVYTNGQVSFNAAVVRILNVWSTRLSTISSEVTERMHEIQEKGNSRFELIEQRRNVTESKFSAELKILRNRIGELEADVASLRLLANKQADGHTEGQSHLTSTRSAGGSTIRG